MVWTDHYSSFTKGRISVKKLLAIVCTFGLVCALGAGAVGCKKEEKKTTTTETKTEVKTEAKTEVKTEAKTEAKTETKTEKKT